MTDPYADPPAAVGAMTDPPIGFRLRGEMTEPAPPPPPSTDMPPTEVACMLAAATLDGRYVAPAYGAQGFRKPFGRHLLGPGRQSLSRAGPVPTRMGGGKAGAGCDKATALGPDAHPRMERGMKSMGWPVNDPLGVSSTGMTAVG